LLLLLTQEINQVDTVVPGRHKSKIGFPELQRSGCVQQAVVMVLINNLPRFSQCARQYLVVDTISLRRAIPRIIMENSLPTLAQMATAHPSAAIPINQII